MATRKPRRDVAAAAGDTAGPGQASAALPSPFPPIAEYAFLSDCHTGCAGRARRLGRLAVRSPVRLAERVRQPARPGGGAVPVRPVRHQRADRPPLRAGHQRAGDDVEDAVGLGRRARRADDGSEHRARTPSRRTPGRRPTTTPSTPWSGSPSASVGASRWSWCASRCSTTGGRRRRGRSSTTPATSPRRPAPTSRCGCTPTCASASKAAGCAVVTCSSPASGSYCALSWAARPRRARPTPTTPPAGSTRR